MAYGAPQFVPGNRPLTRGDLLPSKNNVGTFRCPLSPSCRRSSSLSLVVDREIREIECAIIAAPYDVSTCRVSRITRDNNPHAQFRGSVLRPTFPSFARIESLELYERSHSANRAETLSNAILLNDRRNQDPFRSVFEEHLRRCSRGLENSVPVPRKRTVEPTKQAIRKTSCPVAVRERKLERVSIHRGRINYLPAFRDSTHS